MKYVLSLVGGFIALIVTHVFMLIFCGTVENIHAHDMPPVVTDGAITQTIYMRVTTHSGWLNALIPLLAAGLMSVFIWVVYGRMYNKQESRT